MSAEDGSGSDAVDDTVLVTEGYDAAYAGGPDSPTLNRLWQEHASEPDYPAEFGHISFLTMAEAAQVVEATRLATGERLVDLACGAGGQHGLDIERAVALLRWRYCWGTACLPPEHSPALAHEAGPVFFGGVLQEARSAVDSRRRPHRRHSGGRRVTESRIDPDFFTGLSRLTDSWFEHRLVPAWIPALPDVARLLQRGATWPTWAVERVPPS